MGAVQKISTLDDVWATYSLQHRTAVNVADAVAREKGYGERITDHEYLRVAESLKIALASLETVIATIERDVARGAEFISGAAGGTRPIIAQMDYFKDRIQAAAVAEHLAADAAATRRNDIETGNTTTTTRSTAPTDSGGYIPDGRTTTTRDAARVAVELYGTQQEQAP